jgi:hypothetical protein
MPLLKIKVTFLFNGPGKIFYRKGAEVAKGRREDQASYSLITLCVPLRPQRLCGSKNVILFMGIGMSSVADSLVANRRAVGASPLLIFLFSHSNPQDAG